MKRLLDLVVSVTARLLLSPIWGSTALLVKMKYGSPRTIQARTNWISVQRIHRL